MKSQPKARSMTTAVLLLSALTSASVFADTETRLNKAEEALFDHQEVLKNHASYLETMEQDIATHEQALLENEQDIATHEQALLEHQEQLLDHEEVLKNHADHLENAVQDIVTHEQALVEHEEQLIDHQEVLKNHADHLQTLKDEKADLAQVNELVNHVNQVNTQTHQTLTEQSDEINQHKAILNDHAEQIVNLMDVKADKTELATKADRTELAAKADKAQVAAHDARITANKAEIQAVKATKADVATVARVQNQVNTNTTAINKLHNQVATNTSRIQSLDTKVNKLDKKMRKGLATQSALNGLFQPYSVGKMNVSAAMGGYKSDTALAVGVGYRYNEHVATKAGVSMSTGGDKAVSYNVGVNYEW